ncbi:hypothetical protein M569_14564, partial [Genlisea aurea]
NDSPWIRAIAFLFLVFAVVGVFHALLFRKLTVDDGFAGVRKKLAPNTLRFRSDGTFKILQVADMHFGNGKLTRCRDVLDVEFEHCSDLNTTRFLQRMIEIENPDFVAFTGDNIFGRSSSDAAESMFQAFLPVMKSSVPWGAVLGNHDQESTMSREEIMPLISLMDFSMSSTFPDTFNITEDDSKTKIDGFGNYNLRINGAPDSALTNNTVLNLYFLDSGDRAVVNGIRTYDWIKESQLSWLRRVSQSLKQQHPVPSVAFFHIPIPELRRGPLEEVVGEYKEYVSCSVVNSGVLKALKSMGDVKAVFIGHDHKNDYCGKLQGIWFCYGGGFGYHGYGTAGRPRRARVILGELERGPRSWGRIRRIRTWKRLDDGDGTKVDEQILW